MKDDPPTIGRVVLAATIALAVVIMILLMVKPSHGRDLDGRYANSPLKPWFDTLKSGKGLCCSSADGFSISDTDWETKDGHYRVHIPPYPYEPYIKDPSSWIWVDVPDEALVTEPNRAGRTMVWPVYGGGIVWIRCFMPGPMT